MFNAALCIAINFQQFTLQLMHVDFFYHGHDPCLLLQESCEVGAVWAQLTLLDGRVIYAYSWIQILRVCRFVCLSPTVEGPSNLGKVSVIKICSSLSPRVCMPATWPSSPSGVAQPILISRPLTFPRAYLYVISL